ncbi:DNA polymerase/3'-5' exonuclease PolX [Marininema halotolerans]|uniref:DNA-directed DNA polymerase n=1 Tax=Marininema halotolerans TaxID=1155944 RepID=A0A1I6S7F3_9BACL|nr:DNA polymerase/3'-5' exonuclease PolX [Marininema halotolerans]SFS72708.1 DNA polymerase (family 10) [Marininema halotolerans]
MDNKRVANMVHELADMMELQGENSFKVGAYRKAARAIENSRVALHELEKGPIELNGVGKGTAAVIQEILDTGQLQMLQELKAELPPELPPLLKIPGLGPKTVHTLYQSLGVTGLNELETVIEEGKVKQLPGFGPKKEKNIAEGIRKMKERPERYLLVDAYKVAEIIQARLRECPHVLRVELGGSLRRMKETVKDIDVVVATEHPKEVASVLKKMPEVADVINDGDRKVSLQVEMEIPIQVDVRFVLPHQFITTLHHFTGSKEHNVRVRRRAKTFGWKVSEYGIFDPETEEEHPFETEKDLYDRLDLPFIAPEMREDQGEFDRDEKDLPKLLTNEDYQGDLHMHTRWSDGTASVKEMALTAQKRGYRYIAITDHSQSLKVAGGLTAEDLKKQREEINAVNEELSGITVLAGVEMDILPNGQLDFPDEVLKELDWVIASVHTAFQQDEDTITKRMLQAMENPYVHMIAHPTGRLLNRREPYRVDMDRVFQCAKETGTILECNSNPYRLDLNDAYLRRAKEEGITIAINTDAHSPQGMELIRYGIGTARRGWLEAKDVLNTWPLEKVLSRLQAKKEGTLS